MERIELGPVGGARYYVDRPDWRGAGRAVAGRLAAAAALAGVGAGTVAAVAVTR